MTQLTPKPKSAGFRLQGAAPLLLMALFLLVAQYWIAAVAAVLGALVGLAGGWLNGRREHASWLRDQRVSRYDELAKQCTQLRLIDSPFGDDSVPYEKAARAVVDAVGSVQVIGPEKVALAASGLVKAVESGPPDAINDAEMAFLSAARRALGTH